MDKLEQYRPNYPKNQWTYGTHQYITNRRNWLEIEGPKSQRVRDIDNYIDYINNESDDDTLVFTDTTVVTHSRYVAEQEYFQTYRLDDTGRLSENVSIKASHDFVGDRLIVQDSDVYVMYHPYNLAVKALGSVRIMNSQNKGHKTFYFKQMIKKSIPNLDPLEPYEGIIIPGEF